MDFVENKYANYSCYYSVIHIISFNSLKLLMQYSRYHFYSYFFTIFKKFKWLRIFFWINMYLKRIVYYCLTKVNAITNNDQLYILMLNLHNL